MKKIILLAVGTIGATVVGYFLKPKVCGLFGSGDVDSPSPLRRSRMRPRRTTSIAEELMSGNMDHEFQPIRP